MLTTAEQIRRTGIKEGVERGRKEGIEFRDTEIITHMLRANVPEAQISFLTGLENSKIAEIVAKTNR
ncbi:MAG: hypothetical protein AAFU83_04480 [Bacteroidota bacterium]